MKDIKQIYDLDEAVRQHGDAMTRIKISLMRLPRSSENSRLNSRVSPANPSPGQDRQREPKHRESGI